SPGRSHEHHEYSSSWKSGRERLQYDVERGWQHPLTGWIYPGNRNAKYRPRRNRPTHPAFRAPFRLLTRTLTHPLPREDRLILRGPPDQPDPKTRRHHLPAEINVTDRRDLYLFFS